MPQGKNESSETDSSDPQPDVSKSPGPVIPTPPLPPRTETNEQPDPDSNPDGSQAVRRELHWLEKLNFIGQMSLAVVGIVAACIYGCQLKVMQGQLNQMVGSGKQTDQLLSLYQQQLIETRKQATLMRQQTEGTMAAVIQVGNDDIGRSPCCSLPVYVSNAGHIVANNVTATFRVTVMSVNEERKVGGPYIFSIGPLPLTPPDSLGNPGQILKNFSMPKITQSTVDAVGRLEQYVRIDQEWGYENGFGRDIHGSRCQAFVTFGFDPGNAASKTKPYPMFRMVECEKLGTTIAEALRVKPLVDEQYEKKIEEQDRRTSPN